MPHSRRMIVGLAAAVLAWAGASRPLAAQTTTGTIVGTVTSNGQPVDEAQVQVTNPQTGFTAGVRTSETGRYIIPGLEVGSTYRITVRRIGFEPQLRENIRVSLSQATRADFVLETQATVLGAVTTTARPDALIAPTRTGVQTTVSDTALRRLPTLNRNFTDFVALTPQVSSSGPGLSGGGTNNRYNNIQIDGATEADLFGLGSTGQPGGQAGGKSIGLESVKEYQVLLTPFDVRQGNFAGLLVNAVTKSGTNEFHGTAFGLTRNETLARDRPYITEYNQTQYGLSLGGPILKDRAFFFINPEFQRRTAPAGGIYLGGPGVTLQSTRVDTLNSLLSGYGLPTGSPGLVNNTNPLTNVFARIDVNLPRNMQLVLRHNFGRAEDDNFSRSGTSFRLDNNGYRFQSNKNATVMQLRSLFQSGAFNELFVNLTSIRDRRAPNAGRTPQISVLTSGFTLVSGAERFSQGNELDQDILELTDNFTMPFGTHQVTVGTQNQFYKVRNMFTQASYGVWTFNSLDSLRNGLASQYIVGVPLSGDGAVRFRASQFAGYIQDEWAATPRLNVTIGLRADVPVFNDKPPFNQSVRDAFGRNTTEIPSGNLQWSPRLGFNWNVTGDDANQLRGGAGLFTGRPAFVWLSNAFQNSGSVGVGLLTCNNTNAPTFSAAAAQSPPRTCRDNLAAAAGGEINLLDPDLKFPQNLRVTLGYDRRLAANWVATLEGLVTRGINGLFYQNIALAGPRGTDKFGRVIYGNTPFSPARFHPSRNQVFDVTNQSNDRAYNLTAQLQRRYADSYEASVAYTYGRAWDVQSFTSSTAFSQYRFGRVWGGDQSDDTATRSRFEQRHRIVAQGTYTLPTRTDFTVLYFGESGSPYDYTVNNDLNGDGISLNDPIYVPRVATDPTEMAFVASRAYGGTTYTAAQMAQAFEQFIRDTPCLAENRGRLLPRNACSNPWANRVNVSLRQSLPQLWAQNLTFQVDVFNFLNLLNKEWGEQTFAGEPPVSLLDYTGRTGSSNTPSSTLLNSQPIFGFNPQYRRFFSENLASNYQVQLQLKYSF